MSIRLIGAQPDCRWIGGQRQFCGLNDRASRERGLMAAGTALIALESAA
jgi:hypothetical protein